MHNTGNIPKETIIKKIEKQTDDTYTFTLEFKDKEEAKAYSFAPGQFNMLTLPGIGEIAISISGDSANKNVVDHTVRRVGSVTGVLFNFKKSAPVGVRGAYGAAWPMDKAKGKDVVIIAGGVGLAPVRPAILHILNNRKDYRKVKIIYGAKSCDNMLFMKEFRNWQDKKNNAELILTVDKVNEGKKWKHNVGVVTDCFDKACLTAQNSIVMTCGPEIMMRFAVKELLEKGFKEDQIYVSLERRMQCGVGRCGHCQIGKYFVCKDGPVFSYDSLKGLPNLHI